MKPKTSLQQITTEAIHSLVATAADHHSFFINDVDPSIELYTDKTLLHTAITKILFKTIAFTSGACIRLSANLYGEVVALVIKQKNTQPGTIAISMEQIQPLAEQLGGSISVVSDSNQQVMIAFSFFNGSRAA